MPSQALQIYAIKTKIYRSPQSLVEFILENTPSKTIQEKSILVITSKIVSLAENRTLDKSTITKEDLIEQESDVNLGSIGHGCYLTIKHGLLIPSAGIDESNSENGQYILYPQDPFQSAKKIWSALKDKLGVQQLGIIISDSHTTPLRKGVTGIALSHWGFSGVKSLIGSKDLFGRQLMMTQINIVDSLSSAAVLLMGEGNECQPLAIINGAKVEFKDEIEPDEMKIPLNEDLYYPMIQPLLTTIRKK